MANQGNGRNPASDENRGSWRPQDENIRGRSGRDDEDRYRMRDDDEGFARGYGHWEDRRDRESESYGQGQSGYGAGRYASDRSYQSRNQSWGGGYEDRGRYGGTDDRFSGRGGGPWDRERAMQDREHSMHGRGYGYDDERQSYGGYGGYGGYGHNQRARQGIIGRQYGGSESSDWGNEGYTGRGHYMGERQGQYPPYGQPTGGHRGKGPQGFQRSDDRIRETVCERLCDDDRVDATNIEVTVKSGEVTLSGMVEDRHQKRLAEDIIEDLPGVKDVQNQLRINKSLGQQILGAVGLGRDHDEPEEREPHGTHSSTSSEKRGRA